MAMVFMDRRSCIRSIEGTGFMVHFKLVMIHSIEDMLYQSICK